MIYFNNASLKIAKVRRQYYLGGLDALIELHKLLYMEGLLNVEWWNSISSFSAPNTSLKNLGSTGSEFNKWLENVVGLKKNKRIGYKKLLKIRGGHFRYL